jgi:hypothetical protein
MASKRRVPPSHRATSPEKEMLLIEEGFPNFASIAAPPPRWHSGRHHRGQPALQQSADMLGLQRKKKMPLFREEQRTILHSGHRSCHRRQATRKSSAAHRQIRPKSREHLLASRQSTASSRQFPTLKPNLQLPEPLLCHLRAALPPGEAPDRPGRRGSTLKRKGRRERGRRRKKSRDLFDRFHQ